MGVINISKGDEKPSAELELGFVDGTTQTIPPNATVYFVANSRSGDVLIDREVDEYVDRSNGVVRIDFKDSETDDIPVGVHRYVCVLEENDGDETTFPNRSPDTFRVHGDSDLNRGSP